MLVLVFITLVYSHGTLLKPAPRAVPTGFRRNYKEPIQPVFEYPSKIGAGFVCREGSARSSGVTWTAGQQVEIKAAFGIPHAGNCELLLSYDADSQREDMKWFKIGNWPDCGLSSDGEEIETSHQVSLPKWLPKGKAVFRWSWAALHNNPPEFYIDCADIEIQSSQQVQIPKEVMAYQIIDPSPWSEDQTWWGVPAQINGKEARNPMVKSEFITGPPCAVEAADYNNCAASKSGTKGHASISDLRAVRFGSDVISSTLPETSSAATQNPDDSASSVEWEMLKQINALRKKGFTCGDGKVHEPNSKPLEMDCRLLKASVFHSKDMAKRNYFDHPDPEGKTFRDRCDDQDIVCNAENIAAGPSDVKQVIEMWKSSTGHCNAMMNKHYDYIGIGKAYSKSSEWGNYWTTVYGRDWMLWEPPVRKGCYPNVVDSQPTSTRDVQRPTSTQRSTSSVDVQKDGLCEDHPFPLDPKSTFGGEDNCSHYDPKWCAYPELQKACCMCQPGLERYHCMYHDSISGAAAADKACLDCLVEGTCKQKGCKCKGFPSGPVFRPNNNGKCQGWKETMSGWKCVGGWSYAADAVETEKSNGQSTMAPRPNHDPTKSVVDDFGNSTDGNSTDSTIDHNPDDIKSRNIILAADSGSAALGLISALVMILVY